VQLFCYAHLKCASTFANLANYCYSIRHGRWIALKCNIGTGGGPRYMKLGRAVRYRKVDLEVWAEEHSFQQMFAYAPRSGSRFWWLVGKVQAQTQGLDSSP